MDQKDSGAEGSEIRRAFECGCCLQLLVDATTLPCGHSFCRHCLAQYWKHSKKQSCLFCRQTYAVTPKVNITLRSAVEKLYPAECQKRRREVNADPEAARDVADFERLLVRAPPPLHRHVLARNHVRLVLPNPINFGLRVANLASVCVTVGVVMLALFLWLFVAPSANDQMVVKPMAKWSPRDVTSFLEELGPWVAPLQDVFAQKAVDGYLLSQLDESELDGLLEDIDPLFRRTFKATLHRVKLLGSKPPYDFWQYKELHVNKVVVLTYGFPMAPRLTLLGVYLFDYWDSFLPLVHGVSPVWANASDVSPVWQNSSDVSLYCDKLPPPTVGQWIDVCLKWLFFPLCLPLQFAWCTGLFFTNIYMCLLWTLQCLAFTYSEYADLRLAHDQNRLKAEIWSSMTRDLKRPFYLLASLALLLKTLSPTFFTTIMFYTFQAENLFDACKVLQTAIFPL